MQHFKTFLYKARSVHWDIKGSRQIWDYRQAVPTDKTHLVLDRRWNELCDWSRLRQTDEEPENIFLSVPGGGVVFAAARVETRALARPPWVAELVVAARCLQVACNTRNTTAVEDTELKRHYSILITHGRTGRTNHLYRKTENIVGHPLSEILGQLQDVTYWPWTWVKSITICIWCMLCT